MKQSTELNDRQIYESNSIIRYLNFRQPALFKLVWNTYLTYRRLQLPAQTQDIPFDPITPIVQIQKWSNPPQIMPQDNAPNILFITFTGWSLVVLMDAIIGRSLTMRGANVRYFGCGGILPLCYIHNISTSEGIGQMPCGRCRSYVTSCMDAFGFEIELLKDRVTSQEREQIQREVNAIPDSDLITYVYDDIHMGYAAYRSARWYLMAAANVNMEEMNPTVRNYIFLGRMVYVAIQQVLNEQSFDRIVMIGGLHTTELIIREIAEKRDIDVVCTERGYVANSFVASHNSATPLFPYDHIWEKVKDIPLNETQSEQVIEILNNRRYGFKQLDNLWQVAEEKISTLRQELNLEEGKPIVAVYTNVVGDVAVIDRERGFSGILHWVDTIIEYAKQQPDINFVFRIHPAETRLLRYKSRVPLGDYIHDQHPIIPENVKIIPSASTLSSYTLMEISDFVMVYTSTIGLESAATGLPVGVGAEVHYRDKGFTQDASSPEILSQLMDDWIAKPESFKNVNTELARRYLYLMFYRIPIPLSEILSEQGGFGRMRLNINDWDDLKPGKSKALDTICNGILTGSQFLNPFVETSVS
ncbi:hypothetical protein MASR2M15_18120 [Anaerolineales bacterium]